MLCVHCMYSTLYSVVLCAIIRFRYDQGKKKYKNYNLGHLKDLICKKKEEFFLCLNFDLLYVFPRFQSKFILDPDLR